MTLKYGIVSQSTAVFPQSVENVVNTRSCMKKKKKRHIPWNRYNLEKYRDIHFWSYRPALSVCTMELNSLRSQHDRFTRATSDKRTKSGTNPRYSFGLQTVYLLGPEPWAALDPATPLYTALGDTVKKVDEFTAESITSLSNLVRSIQIDFPSLTTCQKLLIPQERYNVTF